MNEIYLKNIGVPLRTISKVRVFDGVCSSSLEQALENSFNKNLGFSFSDSFGLNPKFQFPFCDTYNLVDGDCENLFPIYLDCNNIYKKSFFQGFGEVLTLSELGIDDMFYLPYLSQLEEFGFNDELYSQHYLGGFLSVRNLLKSKSELNVESINRVLKSFKVDSDFSGLACIVFPEFSKNIFTGFDDVRDDENCDCDNIISLFGKK